VEEAVVRCWEDLDRVRSDQGSCGEVARPPAVGFNQTKDDAKVRKLLSALSQLSSVPLSTFNLRPSSPFCFNVCELVKKEVYLRTFVGTKEPLILCELVLSACIE
jgi:hypothetical protein